MFLFEPVNRQKENELEASEKAASFANNAVQQMEANLNAMIAQLKSKKDEMKGECVCFRQLSDVSS